MENKLFALFNLGIELVNKLIYILISLALLGFMWGVVKFLFSNSNPNAKTEGRQYMLYGILTLFVMTSVWSIVYLFKGLVEVNPAGQATISQPRSTSNNSLQGSSFTDFNDLNRY